MPGGRDEFRDAGGSDRDLRRGRPCPAAGAAAGIPADCPGFPQNSGMEVDVNEARETMVNWQHVREYQDIIYERADGIAKITINRPEVRNAFRPQTVAEM